MRITCTLGVDIGTSSTKGVLVDSEGAVLASAQRVHEPDRPNPGWVEMDARLWWDEFCGITAELLAAVPDAVVIAVGVSGMGPCVLLADQDDVPVRAAILYGVDSRAGEQIDRLTAELGGDAIRSLGGSTLTSQAVGPKIAWVAENEPAAYGRARRLFMPASWTVRHLTGSTCSTTIRPARPRRSTTSTRSTGTATGPTGSPMVWNCLGSPGPVRSPAR
ncbi:hypothetical protein GCM10025867_36370 [Frondihabitans sucicola]|uniref:Carbohydrate kinase FGGY N-terminal domain-containing protein n=1 Tax=Frondihabitans sucicola TaxID=1268041 RepID=A0ABN6Y2W2_9MICO|nr:hypothetical protein GCM10025867_36370 [Frondihabitans sucicola]